MIELLLAFWEVEWMYRTGGFVLVVLSTVTLLFTAYGIVGCRHRNGVFENFAHAMTDSETSI